MNTDKEYFRLVETVLREGKVKKNRTGVDTVGIFGEMAKFNLLDSFPILTTKKVWFKGIVHELLWFIRGDTNIKYLVDNDIHIWDEWAYKKYCDKIHSQYGKDHPNYRPLPMDYFINYIKDYTGVPLEGELGEGTYGGQWRAFPYYKKDGGMEHDNGGSPYTPNFRATVDQLKKVLDKLKTNPDDRRMIVSAWHPYWVDHCALPPCHVLFHFNTEELDYSERWNIAHNYSKDFMRGHTHEIMDEMGVPKRRLNCLLYQRSLDLPIGGPFNISSYALLTCMIAQCVNMVPGVFTWSMGDTHIYINQIPMIKEQLKREPKNPPKLWLNPSVTNLFDFKYEDIKLIGYDPHPAIRMPVAV